MHEDSKLLDHVNNVKVFVDQRACLEVHVLKSLPELSYTRA